MNLMTHLTHRPWPLPSKKWIMRQTWSNLLFIHWPIPAETLQPYVPSSLQIDTFDGYAWLGVVIFVMEGIFPRGLSSTSIVPTFPEINVRTYVQHDDKPGVYFLSLDVNDWISYTLAKKWFHLPYHPSQISFQQEGQTFYCESTRKGNISIPLQFKGKYSPLSEVFFASKDTLDHWLTERYCFYSNDNQSNIYCCEIHHLPWSLQKTNAEIYMNTLFSPFHFDFTGIKPIFHFSKGVDSLIWNIKKIK